jgi:hypothetical protein
MTDDPIMMIRLDDRIQMYKSFLDYDWVGTLEKAVRGTGLEAAIISLLFGWKATANAFAMPFFMLHSMKNFEEGYLRGRDSMPEEKLRLLANALPERMAAKHKLSWTKQRQFSAMIAEILEEAKRSVKTLEVLDMNETFKGYLHGPGGTELQLAVVGLCQICYGATFHAYEHFVTECIRWATGDKAFKAFNFSMIVKAAKVFGDDVCDFSLTHERVQLARAVRNALAHDGGRVSPDMFGKVSEDVARSLNAKLHEQFFVEDGIVRIVAANNHNLVDMLKLRVSKIVERAATLPQFAKAN